jgi:hypothetical protein
LIDCARFDAIRRSFSLAITTPKEQEFCARYIVRRPVALCSVVPVVVLSDRSPESLVLGYHAIEFDGWNLKSGEHVVDLARVPGFSRDNKPQRKDQCQRSGRLMTPWKMFLTTTARSPDLRCGPSVLAIILADIFEPLDGAEVAAVTVAIGNLRPASRLFWGRTIVRNGLMEK